MCVLAGKLIQAHLGKVVEDHRDVVADVEQRVGGELQIVLMGVVCSGDEVDFEVEVEDRQSGVVVDEAAGNLEVAACVVVRPADHNRVGLHEETSCEMEYCDRMDGMSQS